MFAVDEPTAEGELRRHFPLIRANEQARSLPWSGGCATLCTEAALIG